MAWREGNAFLLGKALMLSNQKPRLSRKGASRSSLGNAAGPVEISAAGCTRVIAISPFARATKKEIVDFVAMHPKSLIVLPGNWSNTPSVRKIQRAIHGGSVVFTEGAKGKNGRPAFIISKSRISKMPSQIFAKKPRAADIKALTHALPRRTIRVGRQKATFFICGELIAFNPDGTVKHKRKFDHDIVINPAHTLMGHWNHLGKKLASLSEGSIAVYVTNNVKDRHLTSDVHIYKDGELVKRNRRESLAWSECRI
jgi:hypothetical protein